MSSAHGPPHVLVFPFPAQGHMIPLLDLAHHISTRGLAVTVLVTPKNLPLLDPLLSRSPTIQPLVLPFPDHPSLPPGVEHTNDLPPNRSTITLMHALGSLHPRILHWARSQAFPPAAIISDFFLGWTQQLAAELGIPRLAFYPSGAFLVSVFDYLWLTMPSLEHSGSITLHDLPGSPSFPQSHLPPLYLRYRANLGAPEWEFVKDSMVANASSWGAILNTFDALEGPYFTHLKNRYGHGHVWRVGPLVPAVPAENRGGRSSIPAGELAAWLDNHPPGSVVYVCFGSLFKPTQAQARALASALERSGARFVWCIRGGLAADDASPLAPEGFEKRVATRGLLIRGWAPQVAILSHPAVGSFLTHCGWNSVLEGIAAGVLLLSWPTGADQFVNAQLLVEDAGIAVLACPGGSDAVPDPEKLSRVLAESVDEKAWPEMRARAAEMRRKAMEAVREGGSSFTDVEGLAKELSEFRIAGIGTQS